MIQYSFISARERERRKFVCEINSQLLIMQSFYLSIFSHNYHKIECALESIKF